jgi:hypothetical protein
MKVSKHVYYGEVTQTSVKAQNIPSGEQMERIKLLCENVFDPLRDWVGDRVKINSIFRSPAVNKAVGGSATSQHCANNGAAMDIDDTYGHKTNAEMFNYIRENLDFDQLLWEFGTDKNPDWVHVSYKKTENRKQVLKVKKVNGKTVYVNM